MAKMVCQVDSDETATALRQAAVAAGIMAKIDHSLGRVLVTLDHPDGRHPSATILVAAFRGTVLATSQSDGLGLSALVNFNIEVGYLAEIRGISIEEAEAWLRTNSAVPSTA